MQTAAVSHPHASTRHERSAAVRRALAIVLILNAVVVIIKVIVGVRTHALSVAAAALESGLDLLNNVVGILMVRVASRDPDEDHPYGHDKFEAVGALAIVGFLSVSFFVLLEESVQRLVRGTSAVSSSPLDVGLMLAALGISLGVVWYERARGRALNSNFLLADAKHTVSDAALSVLALASLLFSRSGTGTLDALLALVVVVGIAWSGWSIVRGTLPILVDQRAIDADEIRRVVQALPKVREVRSVRSRYVASELVFAELTITVDGATSVRDAHVIADDVETAIADRFGESQVTVHVEPA